MSFMERIMGAMMERMSPEDKEAMMDNMMEKFIAGITPEERQKMMAEMMPKMMEDVNMMDMMPKMMMGMMSEGGAAGGMPGMMKCGSGGGMPEMMLTKMMPNCIEMMLPKIDAEKRGDAAAAILSAVVKNGSAGMSEEQKAAFDKTLSEALPDR